jgi:acyl-CoA dehydrogenase
MGAGQETDDACVNLVRTLGAANWIRYAVGGTGMGRQRRDHRHARICLIRETLARHSGLADFAFAMQGLGSGAITWTARRSRSALPAAVAGRRGDQPLSPSPSRRPAPTSAAMRCTARAFPIGGDHYVLDGEKTWISNGGIADFYVVFARTGEAPGSRGISAFIVDAGTPGLEIAERIDVIAPHPLARLRFSQLPRAASQRLARQGRASRWRCARSTSSAPRWPPPRWASPAARWTSGARATTRKMFGHVLADFQLTQAKLAQMATAIDARRPADLPRRLAARPGPHVTREAAMAKMVATESARSR